MNGQGSRLERTVVSCWLVVTRSSAINPDLKKLKTYPLMEDIKIGIVGLGRLGKKYAENIAFNIRNAELVAACSIVPAELEWVKENIGLENLYSDFDKMLKHADMDAIFVVSSTNKHAEHLLKALNAGKHVFSEKPLAVSVESCLRVEDALPQYPNQTAVVGFVRRFDPSYRYAKNKIDAGTIGKPFLVRSQTVDKDSLAGFQMEYVGNSGGIFHDFNVHDVDLARWFLESEVKSVWAIGGAYKYPGFGEAGDADNVMATCQFENGTMGVINASRTAMHGHDTYTEVVGTEGTLRIGRPAGINRVEIYDKYGARKECVETFWDRFEEAFLLMTKDFVECLIEGRQPELRIRDATEATRATEAFTVSFKEDRIVVIER